MYGEAHYAHESMFVGSRFDLDTLSPNRLLIRIAARRVDADYETHVHKLRGARVSREKELEFVEIRRPWPANDSRVQSLRS